MKISGTAAVAAALGLWAAPLAAQDFGGLVTLSFGTQTYSGVDNPTDSDYENASEEMLAASISAGGTFGQIGLQFDLNNDNVGSNDNPGYNAGTATIHANYRLGTLAVGVFAGTGYSNERTDSDDGHVNYYGVEAASNFGDFHLAGQLGVSTHRNDHDSLDYTERLYGVLAGDYYLANGMILTGNVGIGQGQIHGSEMDFAQVEFGVTAPIGQTGVLGSASVRHMMVDANSSGDGAGDTTQLLLGVSIPLGGNARDIRRDMTPMVSTNMPAVISTMTEVYD